MCRLLIFPVYQFLNLLKENNNICLTGLLWRLMWMFSLKSALSRCSKSVVFSLWHLSISVLSLAPSSLQDKAWWGNCSKQYVDQFHTKFLSHTQVQIRNVGVISFSLITYLLHYRWCRVYSWIISGGHPLFPGYFISGFLTRLSPNSLFCSFMFQIYPLHCVSIIFLKYSYNRIIFFLTPLWWLTWLGHGIPRYLVKHYFWVCL